MFWKHTDRNPQGMTSPDRQSSGHWSSRRSTAGSLWIQPMLPTLGHEELCELINQVRRGRIDAGCREVVFDLSRVEMIGPQWTVVLAYLISFARSCPARCRVILLQRQPANVFGLYRCNREVASLVENEKMPGSAAARPSAVTKGTTTGDNHDFQKPAFPAKEPVDSTTEDPPIEWQRTCARSERGLTAEGMKSAA